MAIKHQTGKSTAPRETVNIRIPVGHFKAGYPAARIEALRKAGYQTNTKPDAIIPTEATTDEAAALIKGRLEDHALAKAKILRTSIAKRKMYVFKVVVGKAKKEVEPINA